MTEIKIETFDIESAIVKIRDDIISRRKTSELKRTHQNKFDNWTRQLNDILDQISKIEKIVIPIINEDLKKPLENTNLIVTAMVQPSRKNLF
jgi:hypothetical protein